MPKYRKKPIIIEARCVPVYGRGSAEDSRAFVEQVEALADWCGGTWCGGTTYPAYEPDRVERGVHIKTLEGVMVAREGDWIIRGVQGEFYPCKPDIFEATYEEVQG